MTTKPFFSIIIPTLNEAKYLPKLLEDLQQQSFTQFEVIIADGQSTDQTVAKSKSFEKKIAIQVISCPQSDVSTQRNIGASHATGEWILFMDADNRLPKYYLLGIKYQLEKHPKVKAFTTWMDATAYRNRDENLIATTYNLGLHAYAMLNKPTAVGALIGAHHTVVKRIKFRNDQAQFEDYDYIIQIKRHHYPYMIFKEPAYIYSMRRFKKEGTLKMVRVFAQANINSLLGRNNANVLTNYTMQGGSYYTQPVEGSSSAATLGFLNKLQTLLKTVPTTKLHQIQDKLADLLD